MKTTTSRNRWAGASLLSAVAASLCCITPVLALISGASGMASTFSWLEPVRPYLIAITVLVLAFAWYQKLKPRPAVEVDCACETDERTPFMQTKTFLGIVTVFAALMLAFPHYAHVFYPQQKHDTVVVDASHVRALRMEVSGMTCAGCEEHVKHAVNELDGIISVSADHKAGTAEVSFDESRTDAEAVIAAINATGYTVSSTSEPAH
ncbi:MAG: mercuric transport protein MerTP [Flavobacteriales bacterium]|nr:mercuric transport protein MerTP [Flavobacteriales bacterium]